MIRIHQYIIRVFLILFFGIVSAVSFAQYPLHYDVSFNGIFAETDEVPYQLASNRHGVVSPDGSNGWARVGLFRNWDTSSRFSYAFGIDLAGGFAQTSTMLRTSLQDSFDSYSDEFRRDVHLSKMRFWIQQAYADIKYRSIFLSVGSKEYTGEITNFLLSSGDLIWSGNARPIPQIRAGFWDFVNIPFTNGWVQIKGDIAYGIFTDDNYLKSRFNYDGYSQSAYSLSFVTTNTLYHQKRVYFRSHKDRPFVVTIGAEIGTQFAGDYRSYTNGRIMNEILSPVRFKDFLRVIIPTSGDGDTNLGDQLYKYGNHVGMWSLMAEYHFKDKSKIKAYFEWPFEDASGMGKLNGWDGLWGIEYNTGKKNLLSGAVLEYLDFTNQSGPIHWAPADHENTSLQAHATGSDDYYNNFFYNGWAHYGMSMGSPMAKSPAYNRDGYMRFTDNRIRGFHLGFNGYFRPNWNYRVLSSWRKSWGTFFVPLAKPSTATSIMIESSYSFPSVRGLSVTLQLAQDWGTMYGKNSGIMIGVRRTGSLFNKKER